jgi:hypothetical protein
MYRTLAIAASLLSVANCQLVGTETTETHPSMSWQSCTAKGSCTTKSGKITIDANWRWLHVKGGYVCENGAPQLIIYIFLGTPTATLAMNGTLPLAKITNHVPQTVPSTEQTTRAPTVSRLVATPCSSSSSLRALTRRTSARELTSWLLILNTRCSSSQVTTSLPSTSICRTCLVGSTALYTSCPWMQMAV